MILEDHAMTCYLEAGKLARTCREEAAAMVKEGARVLELVDTIEAKILAEGGQIAFPLNISFNHEAAHDTARPGDTRTFSEGDLIKVDLGVHIDGYVADTAQTADLGDHGKLVEATREALNSAIKAVKPGTVTGELSAIIQEEITSRGFLPVQNLTGHGLSQYQLHGPPSIFNIAHEGGHVLEEGMVFAIEPFASTGTGIVHDGPRTEIYSQIAVKPVRLPSAKKILAEIRDRRSLPFARRWLTPNKTDLALAQMKKAGIIHGYPVLHDEPGSFISQAEHTMIVTADGCIVTTQ